MKDKLTDTTETSYDLIVVGSGVSGLHVALEALRANRRFRVAVFEKYGSVGGRAATFDKDLEDGRHVHWEGGAGRISTAHRHILGYMRRYRLKFIPIGSDVRFKEDFEAPLEPNAFEPSIPILLDTIAGLPAEQLATQTIRQILTKIHGAATTEKFLIRFPYRAEVDIMRADMALDLFRHEMRGHKGYGICKEGVSAIAAGMRAEIERRGGAVLTHHELVGLDQAGPADPVRASFRVGSPSEGSARPEFLATAPHCVLALPVVALESLPLFKGWQGLRRLRMTPLVRIYGVFPVPKKGEEDAYWPNAAFGGGRLVTANPVRYVMNGNQGVGSVQISYTDSQDAEHWIRRVEAVGEKAVGLEVVGELRKLLMPAIPSPSFTKVHAWPAGVTYWLPGRYSPKEESEAAWQPFPERAPGVHLCGESYSLGQGWMEGAIEHADGLVRRKLRALCKTK